MTRAMHKTIVGGAAAALVCLSTLVVAAPANADPGDASAIGAGAQISVQLGAGFDFDAQSEIGALSVSNPGQDAQILTDQTLVDLVLASVTVGSSETAAESNAGLAQAASEVSGISATLLGVSIASVDLAAAAATCPVGGEPQAAVQAQGLSILGEPVTATTDTPAVRSQVLPDSVATDENGGTADLSGLTIEVAVAQIALVDEATAVGIALAASVSIEGSFEGEAVPSTVVASVLFAGASCETPNAPPVVPLTATAIDPASGTAAGGEPVAITGTGFVPGTTVAFGANAATDVVVAPEGTTLTAVTPAGAAGATTVTITAPDGRTAELAYTYVAVPAAPVTPTPAPGPGRPAQLAATGTDVPAPLLVGAAAAVTLGAAALVLGHLRIRSEGRRRGARPVG